MEALSWTPMQLHVLPVSDSKTFDFIWARWTAFAALTNVYSGTFMVSVCVCVSVFLFTSDIYMFWSDQPSSIYLCAPCCTTATYPELDCWNFNSLPAKSSDQSHVTLIPSPVIRAHWDWLACSATLDWMIPIYPQPCLPRRSLLGSELPGSSVCLLTC